MVALDSQHFEASFPLIPINITQLVLNTVFVWNDYSTAIILLRSKESQTLALAQITYFNENTTLLNHAFAFFILICFLYLFFIFRYKVHC